MGNRFLRNLHWFHSISRAALKYDPTQRSSLWIFRGWQALPIYVSRETIEVEARYGTLDQRTGKYLAYGIVLTCIGWSPEPLKRFVEECTLRANQQSSSLTMMFNYDEDEGKFRNKRRPTRPLSTIDLDLTIEERLIEDVRKYLHPDTVGFYAKRGIPHRRGYLFHGPPGTS